jgi:hypothetical protein
MKNMPHTHTNWRTTDEKRANAPVLNSVQCIRHKFVVVVVTSLLLLS